MNEIIVSIDNLSSDDFDISVYTETLPDESRWESTESSMGVDMLDIVEPDFSSYDLCDSSTLVPYLEQVHSDLEVISFTLSGVLFFVVFSWCFASIRRTVKHFTGRKLNE